MSTIHKSIIFIALALILLGGVVSARSPFELGLTFTGVFEASSKEDSTPLFDRAGNPDNWTIGLGLASRIYFLDLSMLAMLPNDNSETGETLALLTSASFAIPLVTDSLYLGVGGGMTTNFFFPKDESSEALIVGRRASEVTFGEVFEYSPLHLRVSLDLLIGKAKVGLSYIKQSSTTFATLTDKGGWVNLLRSKGGDKVLFLIQLALI